MAFALADFAKLAEDLDAAGQKDGPAIGRPIGLEPVQILNKPNGHGAKGRFRVENQFGRRRRSLKLCQYKVAEAFAQLVNPIAADAEARGRLMSAVPFQQVAAEMKGLMKSQTGNGPARADRE